MTAKIKFVYFINTHTKIYRRKTEIVPETENMKNVLVRVGVLKYKLKKKFINLCIAENINKCTNKYITKIFC